MTDDLRRKLIIGAGLASATTLAGGANSDIERASTENASAIDERPPSPVGWDPDAPPSLEYLFEARVKLHLPPLETGRMSDGSRVIFLVKNGTFEGPRLRGRVVPDSGADWIRLRPDGTGVLDVRFCLETHDNALLYVFWKGRFWAPPEHAEYELDVPKPDDQEGAWRYYFRTAPKFETSDSRYQWLNYIVAVSKSRTGDGGPIHRVFAVT